MLKILTAIISFTIFNNIIAQQKSADEYFKILPFEMKKPALPHFKEKIYLLQDFGGKADGLTLNTDAFANAVNECTKNGGGKIIVSKGTWITGPIELKSNVNLFLEKDAVIQFTSDHTKYPIIKSGNSSNSFTTASPIYSYDAENIAITGFGKIDGAGESWRPVKKNKVSDSYWKQLNQSGILSNDGKIWWPSREAMLGEDFLKTLKKEKPNAIAEDFLPARDFLRPYMVYLVNCKNILIQGVRIQNSPKFILYPSRCTNLTIDGADFYNDWWAQNGDGIDISACKNVLIYNTTLSVGDDGICMKSSGKNKDGEDANLENIVIAECTVYKAHGGFVIGSNTDGGMKNIYVSNCKFIGSDIGIRVKSNAGRGGKVQNIYCTNIEMKDIVKEAISFDTYYEDVVAGKEKSDIATKVKDKIPEFTNFYLSNINCANAETAVYINGLAEMPVHNIYFNNVNINASKGFIANYAKDIDCTSLKINASKPLYKFDNCSNMQCNN
ncbi:MAG: glycoside hydrolase family 28 protein [Bacteroidetes bacterium]|nr:glycoside hydrolase family 28 protein [Bacteroidota bacterium]